MSTTAFAPTSQNVNLPKLSQKDIKEDKLKGIKNNTKSVILPSVAGGLLATGVKSLLLPENEKRNFLTNLFAKEDTFLKSAEDSIKNQGVQEYTKEMVKEIATKAQKETKASANKTLKTLGLTFACVSVGLASLCNAKNILLNTQTNKNEKN
jgi:hypothetical protein